MLGLFDSFAPQRVKGFMTAPWRGTYLENIYGLLNDAYRFGQGKAAIYPEEL